MDTLNERHKNRFQTERKIANKRKMVRFKKKKRKTIDSNRMRSREK